MERSDGMGLTGVIFFGDSILAGTGASDRDKCCAKLVKKSLSVPVSLKGRNWDTSENGLNRIESDVLRQDSFSHVIILFGNNDCWPDEKGSSKISVHQLRENLRRMADLLHKTNRTALFCNLQPIDINKLYRHRPDLISHKQQGYDPVIAQEEYSKAIEQVGLETCGRFIDIRSSLISSNSEVIAEDGLHPNDKGHDIIARLVISTLNND